MDSLRKLVASQSDLVLESKTAKAKALIMSRSVLLLLLLLGCWMCASFCTAFRMDKSERCLCKTSYRVKPINIVKWKVFPPSASCRAYEIVVTTKVGHKLCLYPESIAWRIIMSRERGPI